MREINKLEEVLYYLSKETDYDPKYDLHHIDMINNLKDVIEVLSILEEEKQENINNTPLEQAIVEEINMIVESYEDYENIELSEETKMNIAYDIINYEDHLWEDFNNTICDYIRKELTKNYMSTNKDFERMITGVDNDNVEGVYINRKENES